MAVGKVTTFKLDERTMKQISDIGETTGAKNGHQSLRDVERIRRIGLRHKGTAKVHRGGLSLEEYLHLTVGL